MDQAVRRIDEIVSGSCPMDIRALEYSLTVLRYDSVLAEWPVVRLLLIELRTHYQVPREVYPQWIQLEDEGPDIDISPPWSAQTPLSEHHEEYWRMSLS